MGTKNKKTSAAEILHKRYIKGNKKRLKNIEQEGKRIEIAQQIYDLRTQRGLSQKEFAQLVGMKQSVISRLESTDYRSYNLNTLERIAQALDHELHLHFVPHNVSCGIA